MTRILGTVTAVILGLIALCGGLVVMAGGALTLMEGKGLAGVTAWAATKFAGRQVAIEGPVTIDWGRPTILKAYGVSVANPDWANNPDLLEVATLRVGVDPVSLLKLDPSIPLLDIQKPRAFLERNEAGVPNWQGVTGSGGQQSPELGLDLYGLQELRLVDGTVTYRDAGSAMLPFAHLSNLRIEATDAASPISVQATAQLATAQLPDPAPDETPPLKIGGSVMSLNDLRMKGAADGDGAPVKITVLAAEAEITAEGHITDPFGARKLDVRLVGTGPDAGTLLQYLGMRISRQPDWRVEADVSGSPPQWQLGNLVVNLGDTSVQGTAGIDLSGQLPSVSADLSATPLALDQLREIAAGLNSAMNAGKGNTDTQDEGKLPLDMLTRFNGDIRFVADPVRSSELPVSSVTIQVRVADGVLTADPLKLSGVGGTVTGQLTVDAVAQPASHSAHVELGNIALDALLVESGIVAPAQGTVSGSLDLRASGGTRDHILSTLTMAADMTMEGSVRDVPLDLDVRIGKDGKLSSGPVPIRIKGRAAETNLTITGTSTISPSPTLEVEVRADGPRLAPVLTLAGVQAGTPGLGHRLEGTVHYEGAVAEISDLLAVIGASRATGSGSLDLSNARPMVRADLDVGHLALDELRALAPSSPAGTSGKSAGGEPPDGGSGDGGVIPDTSLPFDFLKAADARISVRVAELSGMDLPIANLNAEATVDEGVLKVQSLTADFAEGRTHATATLDANAAPSVLHAQVSAQEISSDVLLTSLGVTQKVQGLASGEMTLDSAGDTPDALAAGLDGQVQFYITEGCINTNLVNALALSFTEVLDLLFSSDDSTPVDCMIGSFDATDGIIKPETLVFATPEVVIRGKGRIDLAKETLDLRFTPRPRERRLFSIAVPVEISGTLADPMIDLGAELEAELARNQACQRALDRVSGN